MSSIIKRGNGMRKCELCGNETTSLYFESELSDKLLCAKCFDSFVN